jgi:hypothetical protein
MGLDFAAFWCPVLFAFLADEFAVVLNALNSGQNVMGSLSSYVTSAQGPGTLAALQAGLASEPMAFALAGAYVFAEVAASFVFRDLIGEEKLAFSCGPMFFFPRNLFSATPKLFCLTGADWRTGGFLDCSWMYNPEAFDRSFELGDKQMEQLRFPMIKFGAALDGEDKKPFVLFSNMIEKVRPEFRARLEELVNEFMNAEESDAWKPEKLSRVLELQGECRAQFTDAIGAVGRVSRARVGADLRSPRGEGARKDGVDDKKKPRGELPAPPFRLMSWAIMFAYFATMLEAIVLCSKELDADALFRTTYHLCGIYTAEVIMAVGPGWCAMKGWRCSDVLVHHVPYLTAIALGMSTGCWERWTVALRASLLTAANEGMLVAVALGAPDWFSKVRRLYGFGIVAFLVVIETWNYMTVMFEHYMNGSRLAALPDQWILPAVYYHVVLIKAYIRRWKKTKCI